MPRVRSALDESDRVATWEDYQKYESRLGGDLGLTKQELREAVDATDDWIRNNQGDFNSALPAASRNSLSAKQKAKLFMDVAARRYRVS